MDKSKNPQGAWLNVLALLLSLFGVIVSTSGAVAVYFSQAQIPGNNVWPMPGLALSYWILLGLASFMAIGVTSFSSSPGWLQATWGITGSFIPLIVLGALTIGTLVMIAFLVSFAASLLLSLLMKPKWIACLRNFLIGAASSLVILLLLISLGRIIPQ